MSEQFLQEVETAISEALKSSGNGLSEEHKMLIRRKSLINVLLPIQTNVLKDYGFYGEAGYVQCQKMLMDVSFALPFCPHVF